MFGENSNILWQPKKRWHRVAFAVVGIGAWMTVGVSLIVGWLNERVLVACVLIMGALVLLQLVMTAASDVRTYQADDSKDQE